ncbi:MAG TPA: TonB-dependent receptor [Caulobacteraceae bacterium]|nr:TonB-dependent receptor [Caulobacteraceae bacterium]
MAQTAPAPADAAPSQPSTVSELMVTAQRLDAARDTIQPQVGASTYSLSAQTIQTLPAGEDTPLNQVILQAPGVAQDSFSQLHIRGEHNGLQYRLNGIILPEGLSVFSQALSPQIASNVELITGALPAEYGLRTAGIIDITTKSGAFANGGSATLYGGSHGDIEPSAEYGGSSGSFNYFVSGGYLQNDLGIESPDGSSNPIHDHTERYQGFAYLEDILDPSSSVSAIVGASSQRFQIPDVFGEMNSGLGLDVNGQTDYPSQDLNENQTESSYYGVVSYLHTADRYTVQISGFARYSTLEFTPDEIGDILYNGVAQVADKTDEAGGLQAEGVYDLSPTHTLRGGVIVEVDHAASDTTSQVLLIDPATGAELSPTAPYAPDPTAAPFTIVDNGAKTAETYSVYLQDEWKLLQNLTLNYGVRFDQFDGFVDQNQTSPRVNLVWLPDPSTTIHLGYAKYFTPPPFELIAQETVQKFIEPVPGDPNITSTGSPIVADCGALVATTACPLVSKDTTPTAERANYFDVGAAKKLSPAFTVTIDSYLKLSNHLIDEGQFGAPIILTPFNYAKGRQYGVELTGSYAKGPFSAYANFACSVAQGEGWQSSQFDFPQAQIDYVANHYIYLDHDERVAMSAGGAYLWEGTRFSTDLIFGTGLRQDGNVPEPITEPDGSVLDAIPNGLPVQKYVQVNFGVDHHFDSATTGPFDIRLAIINAFDEVYQIRTGTGVGVFAPQYGPRRGFFAGVTKQF